ncbi:substrate-binding domain-containing protein [uncultured Castellaniella sp.]|uniref:substrate-binding domain-containing protein n=1 Tax=uncultured Castellaniella sp. TaxID=647907 RepID=UPI002622F0EC|nr:substrate-binding domain-containing protein [uncultured Castellaniella sp.]
MTTSRQKFKRVTIADVAREAGLSPTTVSHSLNGIGQVDPKTRQHVKDVAARLKYRPSVRAQRLRTGRSNAIALLSSMPSAVSAGASQLGFFTELAMGSARTALLRGYVLLLAPPVDQCNPLALLDMDGAILLEPAQADPVAQELDERGIRYVTIGAAPGPMNIDLRHGEAADLLLRHLLDVGAQSIGLILGSNGRASQEAFRARYLALAQERAFTPIIHEAPEEAGEKAGYDATRRLLQQHPGLDALCVPIDTFASGAAQAAADAGRGIGRGLRLVTRYDGLRARTCQPPLTAVDLHLDAISAAAVDLLLQTLDGRPPQPMDTPPPALIARASSLG